MARLAMALMFAAVLGGGTMVAVASSAAAQDGADYVGSNPDRGGSSVSGTGGTGGAGDDARGGNSGPLPTTGADIAMLVAVGVAAVGLGWVLVRSARSRETAPLRR